jgi:hypothetical protein
MSLCTRSESALLDMPSIVETWLLQQQMDSDRLKHKGLVQTEFVGLALVCHPSSFSL